MSGETLENLDPEAPLGNKWWSQGVDVGFFGCYP